MDRMDRVEEFERIRELLKTAAGRVITVKAEYPPAPEIELVKDGKLKVSDVPETGLEVKLNHLDFRAGDRVVFNLIGASPEHNHEVVWEKLTGPGSLYDTVPKAFIEKLLNSYGLALYTIYRPEGNLGSNWKFFDVFE